MAMLPNNPWYEQFKQEAMGLYDELNDIQPYMAQLRREAGLSEERIQELYDEDKASIARNYGFTLEQLDGFYNTAPKVTTPTTPTNPISAIEQIRFDTLKQVAPEIFRIEAPTETPEFKAGARGPYYNYNINGVNVVYIPKSFVMKGTMTGDFRGYNYPKSGGWVSSNGDTKWWYDPLFLNKDVFEYLFPITLNEGEINKITNNGQTDKSNIIKSTDIQNFGDGFIIETSKLNDFRDKYNDGVLYYANLPRIPSISGGLTEENGKLKYVALESDTSGYAQRYDRVVIDESDAKYDFSWSKGPLNIPAFRFLDAIAQIVYPVYGLARQVTDYVTGVTDNPAGIALSLIGGNMPNAQGVAAFEGTFLHLPQIAEFTKDITNFYTATVGLTPSQALIAANATVAGGLELIKSGGDVESAFASAAASLVGQNIANSMSGVFSGVAGKDIEKVLSNVGAAATKAALLKQDVEVAAKNAFITSAIPTALNSSVRMMGLEGKISTTALKAANDLAVTAALLPGADVETLIKNALVSTVAEEGLNYVSKELNKSLSDAGLPSLTIAQKQAISAAISAATGNKTLDQIINSFNLSQIQEQSFRQSADEFAKKEGWDNFQQRSSARSFYGTDVTPAQWQKLAPYVDYSTGEDNLANAFKSSLGRSQVYDQFYEFGLDPNEFTRVDTIDDALKAGQSAFISAAIDAYAKGQMSEAALRSELKAAGISDASTNTLVGVAKDTASKQQKTNAVLKDLLDPGSDLSIEGAQARLKQAGLSDSQVATVIQNITSDFSKASALRNTANQIIDDYTAWNSDLSREGALERLITAGVNSTRAGELLGLVDSQVESQRYLKEVGREAVQRFAAGDISREDAEQALKQGLFPTQIAKSMMEYGSAIKEGRQLTPGEMEVAAINNLNQWFNIGGGYQVRTARAEDGTIGLVEARDSKGNNVTNVFIDPYTQKVMVLQQVPERVTTATKVDVPFSYPEFQRLINPNAVGNVQYDSNTKQYFTVDDNGNRLLTIDPKKLPVATPENYHAYLTTWGILKAKGLPLPDPRGYATTTAERSLPPLLQVVGNTLSVPTEVAGRIIGNLGAALETMGLSTSKMTDFGNSLVNQATQMLDADKQQANMRVVDRFQNATNNTERGKAILDSVINDPGAVLRLGGAEVLEELPNIGAAIVTGGGSAAVRLLGLGAIALNDALIESYGGEANKKIQENMAKGLGRDEAVAASVEDAKKSGGVTFLANALAAKIPFGGTAAKEIFKNAFIEVPEEYIIARWTGDDNNTALNKAAFALMISPTADASLRGSGAITSYVATPQGLQVTYADGAKISIGEQNGQVITTYDLPTQNVISNLVTDGLQSGQNLQSIVDESLGIISKANIDVTPFLDTIASAASVSADSGAIANALVAGSLSNNIYNPETLTSIIKASSGADGANTQQAFNGAIDALLGANQTALDISNAVINAGMNAGVAYNTAVKDVTSSLMANTTDPMATLNQVTQAAAQTGLASGQDSSQVLNTVFNNALQAGTTAGLNATDTLANVINQTYGSLTGLEIAADQASALLGAAAGQAGLNNNVSTENVLTSIGTGLTQAGGNVNVATANAVGGQLTNLQTQYNQLSTEQKALADNLVAQGQTLADAIAAAQTELGTQIGEIKTDIQVKYDALTAEQKALADSLVSQGKTLSDAITQAQTELKTEIADVKTDLQSKYDALTESQKAQYDSLTEAQKTLADNLASQGKTLAEAITQAQTELKTEIADVKTDIGGIKTDIGNVKTEIGKQIDALAKTSTDADAVLKGSIDKVASDLGLTRDELLTQIGTTEANLKTEFKTQLDTVQTALQQQIAQQTAQQQEDARLQRIATGSAAALALPALFGQGTKQPFIESPGLKAEVTGGLIDPLAAFKQEVAPEEPAKPPLGGDMSTTYTYGAQPPSYDELFKTPQASEFEQMEEAILPYKAGGSPLNIQMMYAKGGKPREDFRHGKHVAGPGDGQSDDIPAWLADGEFVFPADVVAALGNGSTKAGTDKLYEMMHSIRRRARSAKDKDLPPPAFKSPLDYLKG